MKIERPLSSLFLRLPLAIELSHILIYPGPLRSRDVDGGMLVRFEDGGEGFAGL